MIYTLRRRNRATTPYHSKYYANMLTLRSSSEDINRLTRSIASARVDLNPHQVDAALFAFRSPLSKGAILADEVGLGKTIEAGMVILQRWAERRRKILGTLESGVDFEKRIAAIYQNCRTTEEIQAAFDAIQTEMEATINNRLQETQQTLLENFDEEVHRRLKIREQDARSNLSEYEKTLFALTQTELGQDAVFDDHQPRFEYRGEVAEKGFYHFHWKKAEENQDFFYHIEHPLAQALIRTALDREEECGVDFTGRIKNKRERRTAQLKKGFYLDEDFKALWERIKPKTRYSVNYDTGQFIQETVRSISRMPAIQKPKIRTATARVNITTEGVDTQLTRVKETTPEYQVYSVPDILGYLQQKTELTRSTIAAILIQSGRLGDFFINPQQFMDMVLQEIKNQLNQIMIRGIKYEKIAGQEYEMLLFEEKEIESYLSNLVNVRHSIYDAVVVDSEVERTFAQGLDQRDDIKLFIKLPSWFVVDTPIGSYNPDWAIVKEEDQKIYLIRETKSTHDLQALHPSEADKIHCGEEHFKTLGVDYQVVTGVEEV